MEEEAPVRKSILLLALVVVICALVAPAFASAGDSTDGSGTSTANNGGRVFLEVYSRDHGSSATGQWQFVRTGKSGQITEKSKGSITCVDVISNDAAVTGYVTWSTVKGVVGQPVAFRIIDISRSDRFGWEFQWAPIGSWHQITPCHVVPPFQRADVPSNFLVHDA
jgi:hypothetical protein